MSDKYPELWAIVQEEDGEYKCLGSWRGGYLSGDSWYLNSGIESIEETENFYLIHGYSGSTYHCRKGSYGASPFARGWLGDLKMMNEEEAMKYVKGKCEH